MYNQQEVEAWFDADVFKHKLKVIKLDGLYRHIRCARPDTINMSFDILTWPGYLAYVGDMGDFVFQRMPDMFELFRGNRISPRYWSEKCVAGKCEEYSYKAAQQWIDEYVKELEEDTGKVIDVSGIDTGVGKAALREILEERGL